MGRLIKAVIWRFVHGLDIEGEGKKETKDDSWFGAQHPGRWWWCHLWKCKNQGKDIFE